MDNELKDLYSDRGRSALSTRFMLGLFILKEVENLSDERVCEQWARDPYFQYFTGEEFFQHHFPHERSDMSHWRKRIGERFDKLLQISLRVAYQTGALKLDDLKRIIVDTTVQPKNITFPTDVKLVHKSICQLVKQAKAHNIDLRQSYLRVSKQAALMAGRYAHAKQYKRYNKALKFLKTRLGRIMRDIQRKISNNTALQEQFAPFITRAGLIKSQKKGQKGHKIYSWDEPHVECIGKGKAKNPYEFGCKVSVTTTNKRSKGEMFVIHSEALHGNPFDGHTLLPITENVKRITGVPIERIYVDKGYQGHDKDLQFITYKSGQKRGVHGQIKRELKRRSAIEPVIGHMKNDGHLGRNYLKGRLGDKINAIMAAVGYNFRLLIKWIKSFLQIFMQSIYKFFTPTFIKIA